MRRVAVIGTSHAGALKMAEDRIAARFPDARLRYFVMPGGLFPRLRLEDGRRLRIPDLDAEGRKRLLLVNADVDFQLDDADHLWIVGPRYKLQTVQRLVMLTSQPGHAEDLAQPFVSWAFVGAVIRDMIRVAQDDLAASFGTGRDITVTPAPYPSMKALEPGPAFDRPMAKTRRHPRADWIEAQMTGAIRTAVEDAGWRLLLQPDQTRAGPFATRSRFLGAPRPGFVPQGDVRHMGPQFGEILAETYLAGVLGLKPAGKDL